MKRVLNQSVHDGVDVTRRRPLPRTINKALADLRLDPDADPPHPVGFYERGVMEIPVVFG